MTTKRATQLLVALLLTPPVVLPAAAIAKPDRKPTIIVILTHYQCKCPSK